MTCLIIMLPFGGCGRKKQVTAQKAGVLKPEAPGKEVLDHGEAVVDISNVAQGYVALRYKGSAKKISVEVIGKNNKPRLFTAIPCEVAEIHVITVF